MSQIPFPAAFTRQFSGALDVDQVFQTTAAMDAYLSSPRRYAGQVVTCVEQPGKMFTLNAAKTEWIPVSGGGSSPKPISLRPNVSIAHPTLAPQSEDVPTIVGDTVSYDNVEGVPKHVWVNFGTTIGTEKRWFAFTPNGTTDAGIAGGGSSISIDTAKAGIINIAYNSYIGLAQEIDNVQSPLETGFLVTDWFILVQREDGKVAFATTQTPILTWYNADLGALNARGVLSTTANSYTSVMTITSDIEKVPAWIQAIVTEGDYLPVGDTTAPTLPPDVVAGDFFYVTQGGKLNGLTFSDPDENNNYDGFQVITVEPVELVPFYKTTNNKFLNYHEITIGGGYYGESGGGVLGENQYNTLSEAIVAMHSLRGNLLKINCYDFGESLDGIDISFPTFRVVNFDFKNCSVDGGVFFGGTNNLIVSGVYKPASVEYNIFKDVSGTLKIDCSDYSPNIMFYAKTSVLNPLHVDVVNSLSNSTIYIIDAKDGSLSADSSTASIINSHLQQVSCNLALVQEADIGTLLVYGNGHITLSGGVSIFEAILHNSVNTAVFLKSGMNHIQTLQVSTLSEVPTNMVVQRTLGCLTIGDLSGYYTTGLSSGTWNTLDGKGFVTVASGDIH